MNYKDFFENNERKIVSIYRTTSIDNSTIIIEFIENGESLSMFISPQELTSEERVNLHFLLQNAEKDPTVKSKHISGRDLQAIIEKYEEIPLETYLNKSEKSEEPIESMLPLEEKLEESEEPIELIPTFEEESEESEEPIELMPTFEEESEEPLNSNLDSFGKLSEIIEKIINSEEKPASDAIPVPTPDYSEEEFMPNTPQTSDSVPGSNSFEGDLEDFWNILTSPDKSDQAEPKLTPDDPNNDSFKPDQTEPKLTPDDPDKDSFKPDQTEPKLTPDDLKQEQTILKNKSQIKSLKITSTLLAVLLTLTGLSSVRGCRGSNNDENTNSLALVSDIEADENLFNIKNVEEVSSVAAEVYDDLNNPENMTVPATTEKGSLPVDPNAIVKGTNHIDTTKLVRLYNITQSDVLIMILVANNIDPYDYGYTKDEIMNAIKSGPVQAAHAGGIESVAGAIDNPEYNPYLIESRNSELLPNIFANKYACEFVAKIAASKTLILDVAYNGKSVDNVEIEIKKALEDVIKYIVLSEPLTYSDGTTGCLESLDPFAQYVAISYAYAILSVASVKNINVIHKDQKWTIDSIAGVLSDKTTNVTDSLGQRYQSPQNDCPTNKVKVLS